MKPWRATDNSLNSTECHRNPLESPGLFVLLQFHIQLQFQLRFRFHVVSDSVSFISFQLVSGRESSVLLQDNQNQPKTRLPRNPDWGAQCQIAPQSGSRDDAGLHFPTWTNLAIVPRLKPIWPECLARPVSHG